MSTQSNGQLVLTKKKNYALGSGLYPSKGKWWRFLYYIYWTYMGGFPCEFKMKKYFSQKSRPASSLRGKEQQTKESHCWVSPPQKVFSYYLLHLFNILWYYVPTMRRDISLIFEVLAVLNSTLNFCVCVCEVYEKTQKISPCAQQKKPRSYTITFISISPLCRELKKGEFISVY